MSKPDDIGAEARAEYWRQLLVAAKPFIEQGGTIMGYGYYRPSNPNDFHPDVESCTEEEIANHRAACAAYDAGAEMPQQGDGWLRNEPGECVMHITMAPWGIGSYSEVIPEAAELLAAIEKAEKP